MDASQSLLQQVATRERIGRASRRAWLICLILCSVMLTWLLAARISGVLPELISWWLVPAPLLLGALAGLMITRPITPTAAARLVDTVAQTDDLFLTTVQAQGSAGNWQDLVKERAAAAAPKIAPAQVVRWQPQRYMGWLAGVLAVLCISYAFMPQFDPFGTVAARQAIGKKKKQLQAEREDAKKRIEVLAEKKLNEAVSPEIAKDLQKSLEALAAMKPQQKQQNEQNLKKALDLLGKDLTQAKSNKLEPEDSSAQRMNDSDPQAAQKLREALERGDANEAMKAIEKIQEMAKQLEAEKDPAAREKLKDEMKKEMQKLADAAHKQGSNSGAEKAMQKAMDQLAQAGQGELSKEAMEAMADSLDLSKMEMQQQAQGKRDEKALEKAMEALRMARKANQEGKGGEQPGKAEGGEPMSFEDYKRLYEEAMAAKGQGKGDGEGKGNGEGTGEGQGTGERPKNDDATTDFSPERSPSKLVAGEMLMKTKTKGPQEAGQVRAEYTANLKTVKEGVAEALAREPLPPGYDAAVKQYFDSIPTEPDGAGPVEAPAPVEAPSPVVP